MSQVLNCRPSLDSHVRTWAGSSNVISLYNLADGLICLSRAAACFKAASEATSQQQDYERSGYVFWEAGVKIVRHTKRDIETIVHKHLYVMHGRNSPISDYGRRAFDQDLRPSTSLERYTAIQEGLTTLFPNYANLFNLEGFYHLNRAAICWYHAAYYQNNSDAHVQALSDAKKFWNLGTTSLREIDFKAFEDDVHKQLWIIHKRVPYLEYGKHAFEHTEYLSSAPLDKYGAITCSMRNFSPERFSFVTNISQLASDISSVNGFDFTEELLFWQSEDLNIYIPYNQPSSFIFENHTPCNSWPKQWISGYEVTLFQEEPHKWWMWRLFDSKTKTVRWLDADKVINQHFPENDLSMSGIYLWDFDLKIDDPIAPLSISFNMKLFPSKLDSRQSLSRDQWSITLVSAGHSSGYTTTLDKGHAELWIEGGKAGTYFLERIHLTAHQTNRLGIGTGKVISRLITSFDSSRIRAKSPTWISSSHAIQHIIRNTIGSDVTFEVTGIVVGHNCLTWAVERLQALGVSIAIPRNPSPDTYISQLSSS